MKTELAKALSGDFFNRYFIGYDELIRDFDKFNPETSYNGYPPYNIIESCPDSESENTVYIELAVAGFRPAEISVMVENGILSVEGSKGAVAACSVKIYRHRGISMRSFKRTWRLAEYWEVDGASFDNGILTVTLKQEIPEERKPKRIDIKTTS